MKLCLYVGANAHHIYKGPWARNGTHSRQGQGLLVDRNLQLTVGPSQANALRFEALRGGQVYEIKGLTAELRSGTIGFLQ